MHTNCSHHHAHSQLHDHRSSGNRKTLTRALVITLAFMCVEWVVGWISNSLALMGDAAHMLTDAGALSLSLFALWLSERPITSLMTYGYQRAEILGALFSGLLIWAIAGVLIFESISRFHDPQIVDGKAVVTVGTLGLLVNLMILRVLHRDQKGNLNIRGAYLHVLADALGSLAAITSGVVILTTGWALADPIVTLIVAFLVLASSWRLVRDAIGVLMESVPNSVQMEKVRTDLAGLASVEGVHDLHVWSLTSGKAALSVHLISERAEEALSSAYAVLEKNHGIRHATIQVEHPSKFRSDRCFDCDPEEN